jgi:hypothetical protein
MPIENILSIVTRDRNLASIVRVIYSAKEVLIRQQVELRNSMRLPLAWAVEPGHTARPTIAARAQQHSATQSALSLVLNLASSGVWPSGGLSARKP